MAELDTLMNFNPKDQGSAEGWAFNNADDHVFVHDEIQSNGLGNLFMYELFPLNWTKWDSWAMRHQSAHDEANAVLGLAGTDLTGVDFTDPKKAAEWNLAHYREHQAWHAKLGI